MLSARIGSDGDVGDLVQMRRDLAEAQSTLQRAEVINGGQGLLKLVEYMMIVKAFLMDIDFGNGRSGLDIVLGQ